MSGTKTPVNLICGPLGIGKTTAIIEYLKRHAGEQFVGVLVNDFGPVGLDAAIIAGDIGASGEASTSIQMLPGGCVCCTSAAGLLSAMAKLRALPRLDRILIEPSGLAMVGDMVDLVNSVSETFSLEVRPVITMVEPRLIDRVGFLKAPYYVRMVEAAGVLVANRCDLASAEQRARFEAWVEGLYPPKLQVVYTQQGQIPDEAFDLAPAARVGQAGPARAATGHRVEEFAGGCMFDAAVQFDVDGVEQLLQQMAMKGLAGIELLRLKALLNTNEGWKLYEIARGESYCRPTDYRRDNRVDWISALPLDDGAVRAALMGCAVTGT